MCYYTYREVILITIGDRIRFIRKENMLTLDQFSTRIGISHPALSQIESGKNNPARSTIVSICREFGVNEEWLRTGEGDMLSTNHDAEMFTAWAARHLSKESNEFKRRFMKVIIGLTESEWALLEVKLREMLDEIEKPPDGE